MQQLIVLEMPNTPNIYMLLQILSQISQPPPTSQHQKEEHIYGTSELQIDLGSITQQLVEDTPQESEGLYHLLQCILNIC
ncbi:UNKNOWN [Stylonychia lemnae]|uniref:Uncharacterized protein n=1 Tax=Stylonychia lemnae TaxID=5949 RepID=A0A078B4N1_STYLE|nr:UNKNOWN [Stylonychia lemnae]|eukprot:CDW88468.1 UNKNOWN [Stylonychia lemnae]